MKPTVGRIVHYADGAEVVAAMITRSTPLAIVEDPAQMEEHGYAVSLKAFTTVECHDLANVPFAASYRPGHWSWPPRE